MENGNGNKLPEIHQLIANAEATLQQALLLLNEQTGESPRGNVLYERARQIGSMQIQHNAKIIEGVFDGQNMVGPDGKQYSIPANYASKSKLVEGDHLKLTITADGSFIYKQIGPVERSRLIGTLMRDEVTDEYRVLIGEKTYKVLLASITYFKGEVGDEVVVLVPKDRESSWAAVENIIKKFPDEAPGSSIAGAPPSAESAEVSS